MYNNISNESLQDCPIKIIGKLSCACMGAGKYHTNNPDGQVGTHNEHVIDYLVFILLRLGLLLIYNNNESTRRKNENTPSYIHTYITITN